MRALHLPDATVLLTATAITQWANLLQHTDPSSHTHRHIHALAAHADLRNEPPDWLASQHTEADQWLTFGPDIAMPVINGAAVATLTRGTLPPAARAARNKARSNRTQAVRAKARNGTPNSRRRTDKHRTHKQPKPHPHRYQPE